MVKNYQKNRNFFEIVFDPNQFEIAQNVFYTKISSLKFFFHWKKILKDSHFSKNEFFVRDPAV